jgi:hypothetical protein
MEGQSLLPALRRQPFRTRPIYGETRRYDRDLRFLLDPALDRKLVLDLKAGERRLFSMSEDREELRDLSTEEVLRADSLEDSLRSSIREMESRSTPSEVRRSLSDEEVRILRTLGYVK